VGLPNVEFMRNAKLLHEVLGANDKMRTELKLSSDVGKNGEIALTCPEAVPIRPRPAARLVGASVL
jgi:hypothetical protein